MTSQFSQQLLHQTRVGVEVTVSCRREVVFEAIGIYRTGTRPQPISLRTLTPRRINPAWLNASHSSA